MYNKTRLFFLSLTVVMVLIFGAVGPTPVYADDGTTDGQPTGEAASSTDPQPEEPAEPAAIDEPVTTNEPAEPAAIDEPVTTNEPAEPAAIDEPVTTSEPVEPAVIDEPVTTSEPVEPAVIDEPAAASEPVEPAVIDEPVIDSTLLEQVPDNTAIVVIDSAGETQPLATQETADAIALSDPIWCPDGQSPTPGNNGCTGSFSSFDLLLTHLQNNEAAYQQAGTIYVQMGAYNGGESIINFNSYGFTTFNTYNLNIQGGWDTSGSSIDTAVGTTFNTPMVIGTNDSPWVGSLTFNNLQFGNISNNTALTVYSQNNITLSDVEITNITNGNAATLGSTNGNVTISGGQFNKSNIGAEINAGGNVTIQNGTSFNNNRKAGAVIHAGKDVNISDATFNKNGSIANKKVDGRGLQIESGGLVTLSNIQANGNKLFGANINAVDKVSINNSFFSGNKSYISSCKNSTYYGYGLQVISLGDISLDGVSASNNNLFGAHIEGGTFVTVANGTFNNNGFTSKGKIDGRGLEAKSSGVVTLNNVQANQNFLSGANVEVPGIALIYNSTFSGNHAYTYSCSKGYTVYGYGLRVVSGGSITLDGVVADNNYLSGALLEAGGSIDISNTSFNGNKFSKSNKVKVGSGLEIKNGGGVTLTNVQANNNSLFGANIDAGGNVIVSNSIFSGNHLYTSTCNSSSLNGYGLKIVSAGNTTLDKVTAEDNYLFGADVETTTAGGNVVVSDSNFSENGFSKSSKVWGYGLEIDSLGGVSLSGVQTNDNKLFGTDIDAVGDVVLYNSIFSGNQAYTYSRCGGYTVYGYGLQAVTDGGLTIDGVAAEENYLFGAHLEAVGGIEVSNSSFDENEFGKSNKVKGFGLEIVGLGGVSLNNVTADENNLFGASLSGAAVTIENSTFSNNRSNQGQNFYGYGLQVVAPGDIFLDGVTANYNNLWGGSLDGLNVTVKNSQFNNNVSDSDVFIDDTGLLVNSKGDVDLDNVEAKENRLIGADIVATGNVTIANSNFFRNQGITCNDRYCLNLEFHGYGLQVVTPGSISLSGVTANENYLFGASLSGSEVTIENSTFSHNTPGYDVKKSTGRGLIVKSDGKVTLSGVEANNNDLFGANIEAKDVVSVSNSFFIGNEMYTDGSYIGYGLQVDTPAAITLDHVTASDNGTTGAILNTESNVFVSNSTFDRWNAIGLSITTSGAEVTIENSIFNDNGKGLIVKSDGKVTLSGVEANNNDLFGANIEAKDVVSISNSFFIGNQMYTGGSYIGYGLQVDTPATITLDHVTASDNGTTGAILNTQSDVIVLDSTFDDWNATGMSITTPGHVTLTNVIAANNALDGVDIIGSCTTTVDVENGIYSNNGGYGIKAVNATVNLIGSPTGSVFQTSEDCLGSNGGG